MKSNLSKPYLEGIISLSEFQFKETHLEPKRKEVEMEETFGKALESLSNANLLDTSVVNLLALVSKRSVELYTKDTCQEFHLLLCSALRRFFQ